MIPRHYPIGWRLGAVAGLTVGVVCAAVEAWTQINNDPGSTFVVVGIPTLLSGVISGLLLGPSAVGRLRSGQGLRDVFAGMSLLAVFLGDVFVSAITTISVAGPYYPELSAFIGGTIGFAVLGLIFVAPFALVPITCAVWAWLELVRYGLRRTSLS